MGCAEKEPAMRKLEEELMLFANKRLWESGVISDEIYEQAQERIVSSFSSMQLDRERKGML